MNCNTQIELSNIDELNDISVKHKTEIFKRAAEISPNILECTIGPKVNLFRTKFYLEDDKENLSSSSEKCTDVYEANIKTSPQNKTTNDNTGLASSPLFDLRMIKNALALKSSEKERKVKLRKEIEKHHLDLEEKIKKNKNDSSPNQTNSLINLRNQNDQMIFEEAERYVTQEQEKNIYQLRKINHEKNRKLREISLKAIIKAKDKFMYNYEKLAQMFINQDKSLISDVYNKQLKELVINFDALIQKLKLLQIGPAEVLMAEALCDKVILLQNKLKDDLRTKQVEQKNIELQRIEADQQRAKEQVLLEQEQELTRREQNVIQQKQLINTVENTNFNNCYASKESFEFYETIMKYFAEISERVRSLELDQNTKKYRVACKRVLNIQVTTISASSPQHLRDKFDKIYNFVSGENIKQSASDANINDHPLGKDFSYLLLVRLLVMQAKAEISSNVQVAFPIASVIISLWNVLPDFGRIFLGQIFFDAPFLVPYFYKMQKGGSQIEYLMNLGYKFDENGTIEDHDSFLKRQTGIIRLYFAIMISSGSRTIKSDHPYSIENGWKFICNIIRLNPLSDICATVIYEFLQLAGNEMYLKYGKQFHKLLIFMQQFYIPKLSEIDDKRPRKERLETFLQQILQKGTIDKPKGVLDREYW